MKAQEFKQLIKESVQEYIREIDAAGDRAAIEAKMAKCQEAIDARKKKIEMSESLEEMKDMINPDKVKELGKEVKFLEKSLNKYQKQLDKMDGKAAPKNEEQEVVTEENPVEESDVNIDVNEEETIDETQEESVEETQINESFSRMQKLAGIITEDKK